MTHNGQTFDDGGSRQAEADDVIGLQAYLDARSGLADVFEIAS